MARNEKKGYLNMERLNRVNWNRFKELATKLIEFKAKISRVPIRAESWEEVIYAVLLYMEYEVFWEPTSHAKGGKVTNNQVLTLSSYRLTRFGTLPKMLEFLNISATELDVYLICAREEEQDSVKYHIFKILPSALVPEKALNPNNWEKNDQGWKLKADVGFEASIVKKMSNQLWYSIPLNFSQLERLTIVKISKKDIGSTLVEILAALDKKKWQIRESLESYGD
jgi:hypothetical protein